MTLERRILVLTLGQVLQNYDPVSVLFYGLRDVAFSRRTSWGFTGVSRVSSGRLSRRRNPMESF